VHAAAPQRIWTRRLAAAFGVLAFATVVGTFGYHQIGDGRWSLWECLYMTVVTVSSVGFAETLPGMRDVAGARAFTIGLIVLGSGTLLYFVSTLTAFIVEGDLVGALRRSRMQKKIDALSGHVVVCGVGSTGSHVLEEMILTGQSFVAVDQNAERLARVDADLPNTELLYVVGDATDDATLHLAGIERARGVIAALHDDTQNVFLTVTARALNSKARIVSKAVETTTTAKLLRAGADSVVSPNQIGALRLASEMIRPRVVEFLDLMMRDREQNLRIEEIPLPDDSKLIGAALKQTEIRKNTAVLVIAIRAPDGRYEYNPRPDAILEKGMTLIVLATTADVIRLRDGIADGSIGRIRY
jgi:voltage-gated potassium channel